MAKDNDVDEETTTGLGASSNNYALEVVREVPTEKTSGQEDGKARKDKQERTNTVPFYKLFSFADPLDCLLMIIGTISAAANGVCVPLLTFFFGDVVNGFGQNAANKRILHVVSAVCLKLTVLGIASAVASLCQMASWMVTGERQAARIRTMYLKTILRQDIGFFDKELNTGELVGRMSGDTVLIQEAMGEKVGKFIQLAATFIGGFAVAFSRGWLLTLVMLSSIPPVFLSGAIMSLIVVKMAAQGQSAYSAAANVAEQTIGSIRTVVSFTGEKLAVGKYNELMIQAYKSGVQEGLATGFGFGLVMCIMYSTYALAMWYGGKMVIEKGYTGGDILNIIFAILSGSMSLGQASPCLTSFAAGQAAAFKMFEVINRKPLIDSYDTTGQVVENMSGDIELRDVQFSYPSRPDERIFDGFSLHIPSGTNAALVGQSGSGKSTVISLIERFYDPQAGDVLIDGINLKDFKLKWIRQKIGLVSQEPALFASSIRENISYGKDGATDEEIWAAATVANAANFIKKLPQGLETMVGEHGDQLSGGQKQRIAIARAILKDPKILLLDEATSALDAESERIVQDALDRIMVSRTTIIVAHRLSTIRNVDMIAVVHQGKIIEKGSHEELTRNAEGAYCQLIRLQELNKEMEQDTPDQIVKSGRHSSHRISFRRSSSYGSARFSTVSLPGGPGVLETTPVELDDDPPKKVTDQSAGVPLYRLASLNKPEIPVLLLGAVAAVINGAAFPLFGVLLSGIIKTFYEPEDKIRKDSRFWALMFLILGLAILVMHPIKSYFFAIAGCKLIKRVRSMCFDKMVHMEIEWFDKAENSSGAIGARLSSDAAALRGLVGDALGLLVENLSTTITALIITFGASWQMALIVLGLLPVIGANGFIEMKYLRGFSADAKKSYEEASQIATDAVGSIRTVASFCAEDRVMQLYKEKCQGPVKTAIRHSLIASTGIGFSYFLLYGVYAFVFYSGARLIQDGLTTFTDVFRVFFALATSAWSIMQSRSLVPDSTRAKSSAISVFAILDRKSKIDSSDSSGEMLEDIKGEIEFQHVSFRYPNRPDIEIFGDICLAIRSGKTVALVGESGSGKSTVISLLQRFYDLDSGQITLDGVDIRKLNLKWLRQQMGLVSQEPTLFNDTIRANIAYGKEGNTTEAEIMAAAKTANAHSFISGLQNGYETIAGERGVQLSGGQKQRVAIARAVIKAPKILLLDEATSALDTESERVVQDALDRVMEKKTTIVVAHRLSTIKGADMIAVVKNGVIAERGKHETLINIKDGIYASLVALHSSAASS
ncbi:hypothetical protein MLD38_017915 [Melastoma candidum]|uniref:Uncharacterized protein n=1 Tax=Melastoma candidum TaxID=119954 RepID=A0ACB9QRL9_9MYRT|nr:hypothetical protein MLD38_017915 [Melastoma candidum]